jgi:hypothetical protein
MPNYRNVAATSLVISSHVSSSARISLMAKKLLPVLALLLISGLANAQTATVFGTVNEIVGDQYFPIPFARVTLAGEQHHSPGPVVPDVEGKFTLHLVAAGVYEMRVSAVGFDPLSTEIEVEDGDSLHVRIRMGDKEIAGIMIESEGAGSPGQHLGGHD